MFENFRRWQRYSISTKALIKRRDEGLPKGVIGQVTTISQGGMGFYSSEYIEKSVPVSIELLLHSSGEIKKKDFLEGKIASICRNDNDYYIGVAFDKEIPGDHFFGIVG